MTALAIILTYLMVFMIWVLIGDIIRDIRIEKQKKRTTEIIRDIYDQQHPA